MQPWIHPHLSQSMDPNKGRKLQASQRIQKGEVLLIDPPYAIIPISNSNASSAASTLLCSNPECNISVLTDTGTRCAQNCNADIIWCTDACRKTDATRHAFECTWLARYTTPLVTKWGEYNFGMLWLIVRILARRYTDPNTHLDTDPSPSNAEFKTSWPAISALCGSPETWSQTQTREWTVLVKKYLSSTSGSGSSTLQHDMSNDALLRLICKEEANSFGLYPRETGICPPPEPSMDRGEQFGAAVYPTASIANHECWPNIFHKPDRNGRMVFTANRDIAAGEECCIAYFDLSRFGTLAERRGHLGGLFRFKCRCGRCLSDEGKEKEIEGKEEERDRDGDEGEDGDGDTGSGLWGGFPDLG